MTGPPLTLSEGEQDGLSMVRPSSPDCLEWRVGSGLMAGFGSKETPETSEKSKFARSGLIPINQMLGACQRSGEGVVRRNGRPKGCFWRVRFFSGPSRLTISPHDAFSAPLARPQNCTWGSLLQKILQQCYFTRQRHKAAKSPKPWCSKPGFGGRSRGPTTLDRPYCKKAPKQ